jgi:glycyl-tRNA synthetase
VTVDYESLEDDTVTVRERDSTDQTRVPIDELPATLTALRAGTTTLADL